MLAVHPPDQNEKGKKFDMISTIKYSLTALFAWASAFFIPVWPFIAMAVALIVVDFATGIRKALAVGEKITSRGIARTVNKFIGYPAAILLCEGMERVFFDNSPIVPLTYIVAAFICATEFKSVLENIGSVTGVDAWQAARVFLEKFITSPGKKDEGGG